jgi:ribosomal-protein-alanine N-acetyltransferase
MNGDLVGLREYEIQDTDAMVAWISDQAVVQHLTWNTGGLDQARSFIARTIAQSREDPRLIYEFAVVELETGFVVGSAGIRIRDRENCCAELGYALRRDRWRRGYMTDAVRMLLAFGFGMGLHRIEAVCRPENGGSARVLEKAGLQFEGRLREVKFVRGEWWDSMMYAAIANRWPAKQAPKLTRQPGAVDA